MRLSDPIVPGVPFYWREVFVSKHHPALARELPVLITPRQEQNVICLVKVLLAPARAIAEWPFTPESWFRSPVLNVEVGGSLYSQHMVGEAVDLSMQSYQLKIMYEWWIEYCPYCFGQLRYYPDRGFIHISLPGVNCRGEYTIINKETLK